MPEVDPSAIAWRLTKDLVSSETEASSASALAHAASRLAEASAARVWLFDRARGYRLAATWPESAESPAEPPEDLARVLVSGIAFARQLQGDSIRSRLLIPLLSGRRPLGALELLENRRASGAFSSLDGDALQPVVDLAESALTTLRQRAAREKGQLEALDRLTHLFDIDRSLLTTLEIQDLIRLVAQRVRAALEVEEAYLWLLDDSGQSLTVSAAAGGSESAVVGWELPRGSGLAGRVAASGEALLVADPEELPEAAERKDIQAGLEIRSAAAAPVLPEGGELLGVLEVVNRADFRALNREDLAFLREVAETSAWALANARRLDAERRASDLGALLETAQELVSNLEVPKVCFTLVHKAATVLPYHRAAVGLIKGSRIALGAVSGQTFVDETLPEMRALRDLLEWAGNLEEGIYVVQEEDGTIDAERPETREKFRAYFQATGSRSFLALPLQDEEGRLGVFALEAPEPYAFSERGLETARLLAVQAAVAIRNAVLYQQLPMARVLQPWARSRQRFTGMPLRRKVGWGIGLLGAAAALLVPVPRRVDGEVRVLPEGRLTVTPQVEGRVAQVFVREGDRVEAGQILALMDETDLRLGEAEVRSRYEVAAREQSRLRAEGRTAEAAVFQARVEGLRAESDLWKARLAAAQIRSPAAGVIATPRVEEQVGAALRRGEAFCEVVDPSRQRLEVVVPEDEITLVKPGMPVKVKLYAYPEKVLAARVERVGVAATLVREQRVFLVQSRLVGDNASLSSGMAGHAKIRSGRTCAAWIVLRRPARGIWSLIWGWLP